MKHEWKQMHRCIVPLISLVVGCAVLGLGCGKKDEAASPPPKEPLTEAPETVEQPAAQPEEKTTDIDPEITKLIEQLGDEDRSTQAEAIYRLGKMGPKAAAAVEALEPFLSKSETVQLPSTGNRLEVSILAAQALGHMGEPAMPVLLSSLENRGSTLNAARAKAFGLIGEPAVKPLLEALQRKETEYGVASAMKAIGAPAVQPLLQELKNAEAFLVRRGAAVALGEVGSKNGVPGLINALQDEGRPVRAAAAKALGQIKDSAALEPLCKMLENGPDKYDRVSAAMALSALGSKQAAQPLIDALTSDNEDLRKTAAKSLGELEVDQAVEPLVAMIKDQDRGIREETYIALGAIGDKRAVQPLILAMKEENRENLREDIATSLGQLGDTAAVPVLLEELQNAENYVVLRHVLDALTQLPDARSIPVLIQTLKRGKEAGVNTRACAALAEIGKPAAAPLFALVVEGGLEKPGGAGLYPVNRAIGEITGVSHPNDAKKMLEWWEKNSSRYEAGE